MVPSSFIENLEDWSMESAFKEGFDRLIESHTLSMFFVWKVGLITFTVSKNVQKTSFPNAFDANAACLHSAFEELKWHISTPGVCIGFPSASVMWEREQFQLLFFWNSVDFFQKVAYKCFMQFTACSIKFKVRRNPFLAMPRRSIASQWSRLSNTISMRNGVTISLRRLDIVFV